MTYETIMAGFGGQGLLFSGKVLAHAALIEKFAVKNEAYVRFCLFPQRKCGIILAFQGEKRTNKWK